MSRPRWKDPRLFTGIALVAVSAAGGAYLFAGPDTVPVYRARSAVVPGTALADAPLELVEVAPNLAGRYVGPAEAGERAVSMTVHEGELVPKSAVVERTEGADLVLPLLSEAPGSLGPGAAVDVWAVVPDSVEHSATAQVVAHAAILRGVGTADSLSHATAEVRLADADVYTVLPLLSEGAQFVLVGAQQ